MALSRFRAFVQKRQTGVPGGVGVGRVEANGGAAGQEKVAVNG
jgi:hypothetical protein